MKKNKGIKEISENSENEYNIILKEIEDSAFINSDNYSSHDDIDQDNKEISNELSNKVSFLNNNNSCAFTSFLSIFIFALNPSINDYLNNNIIIQKIIYDNNKKDDFLYELFLKFINEIIDNMNGKYLDFYNIYQNFNASNKSNLYKLLNNENKQIVPIVVNYRPLYNNKLFSIVYKIKYFCTGNCKYRNGFEEELITPPFIDIPLISYNDIKIKNIDDLFKEYIFIDLNTICNLETCYNINDDTITNFFIKKYTIIDLPYVLSINTNISDYSSLINKKDFINKIFKENIVLYQTNYLLIGFVTLPIQNHFICYFKCLDKSYPESFNFWFRFDDLKGKYIKINNFDFSINNIRETEPISLLIYLKKN